MESLSLAEENIIKDIRKLLRKKIILRNLDIRYKKSS